MTEDRFVSYAQNMEDVMLWRALKATAGNAGFYIDVGAADPTALNITRAFYDRGWSGVNVEALPEQAARLRAARPRDVVVHAALSRTEGAPRPFQRVTLLGQTGLSTLDPEEAARHQRNGAAIDSIEVPVTTLAAICREHVQGPVHFLKIDVEGAEADVLAGADFAACRPWIVLVEATPPLEAHAATLDWEPALLAAGYHHVWSDGLNRFYLAEEHAHLAAHFTLPPNVFDNYTVYDAPLQDHLAAVATLSERRAAVIDQLEAELAALTYAHDLLANQAPPPPAPDAPPPQPPQPPSPGVTPTPGPAYQPSLKRKIANAAWRLIRPVMRPLIWRSRNFLIGPILEELAGHRIRLDQLVARPLTVESESQKRLASAMERTLLTLALEDGRRPAMHLVDPPRPTPPDAAQNPAPNHLPNPNDAR